MGCVHDGTLRNGDDRVSVSTTSILYVITDLNIGGVPLHLRRLAGAMRSRGFNPCVVSLAKPGRVGEMLQDDGIEVRSCDGCCGWDVRVVGRLARIMGEVRPEIVHALLFHANVASRFAWEKVGFDSRRLLCEIQTVEVERRWHLLVDRMTHMACRFTIANSPSVFDHLTRVAKIPPGHLRLVRGGIDPKPYQQAGAIDVAELGLSPDASVVLWVGRLDPVKGLAGLISAFHLVVAGGADGASRADQEHLLLVGDGPQRGRLERQIRSAGLSGRVHLLGRRDDVPALLKAADVFVLPSRTEGLPNALLEAMAAGCAIVTTDVPGCRDLIEHERTGLIVTYGDTQALADAISRLLADRTEAAALGERASDVVSTECHIEHMLDSYAALYHEVAGHIEIN